MVPKNAVNSRTVSAICASPVIVAVLQAIAAKSTMPSSSARTPDDSPYTRDVSPKSSKVGAFLPHPPPFREKNSVSRHQKSRKGANPIRPNDAILSFLPIRRGIFVYTALHSDVLSAQACKNNHPSFVSKLGWLYGKGC